MTTWLKNENEIIFIYLVAIIITIYFIYYLWGFWVFLGFVWGFGFHINIILN